MARKIKIRLLQVTFTEDHKPAGYQVYFTHWSSTAIGGSEEGIEEDITVPVTPLNGGEPSLAIIDACKAHVNDAAYRQTYDADSVGLRDGAYRAETWSE